MLLFWRWPVILGVPWLGGKLQAPFPSSYGLLLCVCVCVSVSKRPFMFIQSLDENPLTPSSSMTSSELYHICEDPVSK